MQFVSECNTTDACNPSHACSHPTVLGHATHGMDARVMYPRVHDAMAHLDQFPLRELPERELNLLHLVYSLVMVSLPVEVWHQPRVIDSGTAYFDRYLEPVP